LPHKDHLAQLEPVFQALCSDIPHGGLTALSEITKINDATLSQWKKNLQSDPRWHPRRSAYRKSRALMSEKAELMFAGIIIRDYLDPGSYFCDQDFRRSATQQEIDQFIARVDGLMHEYSPTQIVNMDETHWKAVVAAFLTWAEKGTESVSCCISNDEKEGVTVIAAIDVAGNKLPLTVIGKGKTRRCLGSYKLPPSVWGLIPESGWTTSQVMVEWLTSLRQRVSRWKTRGAGSRHIHRSPVPRCAKGGCQFEH
jgi:hypothetical protein